MKYAGLKNDGAWFRANKWLNSLDNAQRSLVMDDPEIIGAASDVYDMLEDFAGDSAALISFGGPADPQELLAGWRAKGIPRQIYMGQLSTDMYTKVGAKFVPVHRQTIQDAGEAIRKTIKLYRKIIRQVTDITNLSTNRKLNPGGVADASIDVA